MSTREFFRLDRSWTIDRDGPTWPYKPLWDDIEAHALFDLVARFAKTTPDKVAAIALEGQLTYRELVDIAPGWATAFAPHVRQDLTIDPLFFLSDDNLVQIPVKLACWRVGLAHAAIDPTMPVEQRCCLLGACPVGSCGRRRQARQLAHPVSRPDAPLRRRGATGRTGEPSGLSVAQPTRRRRFHVGIHVCARVCHRASPTRLRALRSTFSRLGDGDHMTDADIGLYVGPVHTGGWGRNSTVHLCAGATSLSLPGNAGPGTMRVLARHPQTSECLGSMRIIKLFGNSVTWQDVAHMRSGLPDNAFIAQSFSQTECSRIGNWFVDEAKRGLDAHVPMGYPASGSQFGMLVERRTESEGEAMAAGKVTTTAA